MQQDLSRCVIDQVSTADDVCHVLESVIDDNGELIGPESVGSPNNKITDFLRNVLFKRSLPSVRERDDSVIYKKTPRTNWGSARSVATSSWIDALWQTCGCAGSFNALASTSTPIR